MLERTFSTGVSITVFNKRGRICHKLEIFISQWLHVKISLQHEIHHQGSLDPLVYLK